MITVEDILSEFLLKVPSRHIELMSNLSREEKDVYLKLGKDPVYIDELCKKLKKNSSELFHFTQSGTENPGSSIQEDYLQNPDEIGMG